MQPLMVQWSNTSDDSRDLFALFEVLFSLLLCYFLDDDYDPLFFISTSRCHLYTCAPPHHSHGLLLQCLSSVASALGDGFVPYAQPVFERCIVILKRSVQAAAVLRNLFLTLFVWLFLSFLRSPSVSLCVSRSLSMLCFMCGAQTYLLRLAGTFLYCFLSTV